MAGLMKNPSLRIKKTETNYFSVIIPSANGLKCTKCAKNGATSLQRDYERALLTGAAQGRDRFEDPRETAVKSDVKIKARFTPPRDPREKVERPKCGEGGHGRGIYTCRPVVKAGVSEGERGWRSRSEARAKIRGWKKKGGEPDSGCGWIEEGTARRGGWISRPAFM